MLACVHVSCASMYLCEMFVRAYVGGWEGQEEFICSEWDILTAKGNRNDETTATTPGRVIPSKCGSNDPKTFH